MTIEEAKQMATQGDIRAMCSLGDFYIKQNTGEGIREAAVYGIQRSPFCFRTAVFRNQRPPIF